MQETTVQEKIEPIIKRIEESTDYTILAEIKLMLDSVCGSENNQITKPSYESLILRAKEIGINKRSILSRILSYEGEDGLTIYLQSSIHGSLDYQITIRFPEITIQNGSKKHLIRDIYVRLFLRPNGTLLTSMSGMRTTLTEAEFLSRYIHSHLPGLDTSNIGFHTFCTGVGEINQVLALLGTKFTSANFMMLLMHIKNFLEWESREGHPYMFIDSIFKRTTSRRSAASLSDFLAEKAAGIIVDRLGSYPILELMKLFSFSVTERSITCSATAKLEQLLAEQMMTWNLRELLNTGNTYHLLLSRKDAAGVYYDVPADSNSTQIVYPPSSLEFKGKIIPFEVIERSSQTKTNETYYANPKITNKACEKLSHKLTTTALTTPGIKSGSALVHRS